MIRQMHADLMLAVNNFLTHFETFCNTSGLTEQLIYQKILLLFLKIGPTPASFSFIFGLFKQTLQFYNNNMWKMSIQYTVPGFEPTTFGTWVYSHNH